MKQRGLLTSYFNIYYNDENKVDGKMAIKAVVFDYGKVISFPPKNSVMEELANISLIETSVLEKLILKHRGEFDRGTFSVKEYYKIILYEAGVSFDSKKVEKMADIDIKGWTSINPETVILMKEIKNAGYLLGILSNMPHDFLALHRNTFPVFKLTHINIFSCEIGFIKPEKEIYEILLEKLLCKAEEIIFFDDIQINVAKANEIGIMAFLWENVDKARSDLKGEGLLI